MGEWLRPIDWQWFITATFSWNVRSETADKKLQHWVNSVERELKTRLCFVAGKERKPRSHGIESPHHFHILATSLKPVPERLLIDRWTDIAGKGRKRDVDGKEIDERILVAPYDRDLRGPQYALKKMSDLNGDWQSRWLRLFHPKCKGTATPNHRTVRTERRFNQQKREAAFGTS